MFRTWIVLAAFACGAASGQAPAYSTNSIVNGANFAPGPFAPNSFVTIFGTNLSYEQQTLTALTASGFVPNYLGDTRVYVDNLTCPVIYVSATQINFLIPGNLISGSFPVRVVRQGVTGPEVSITLAAAAPQLFVQPSGYVIAQHTSDYSLVTPDAPAKAGETVVIYASGLGATAPNPLPGEIPIYPALVTTPVTLLLNGAGVDSSNIFYAGVTPGLAGVYQINVRLPANLDADPEIRAAAGGQTSASGLKLAAQASSTQPDSPVAR